MTQKSELGKIGEDRACEYLVDKGFKILERNAREKWGELDIVAKAQDKTLVFVEVKTMENFSFEGLGAEDQMTDGKLNRFKKAAALYAGSHEELIQDKVGWRLDMLALTKIGNDFLIKHYENVA